MNWRRLLVLFVFSAATAVGADTQESWERDLSEESRRRIGTLIEKLDSLPSRRAPVIEELHKLSQGDNRELVLNQLSQALTITNMQLRDGLVVTLATIGDLSSVPILIRQLQFDTNMLVRTRVISALPLFLVEDPLLRQDAMVLLRRNNTALTERVQRVLRMEPFRSANGQFDPERAHIRDLVVQALSEQLDPVNFAIDRINSKRDHESAMKVLLLFCGQSMGHTQDEWRRNWKVVASDPEALREKRSFSDLATLQTESLQMLENIGADGTQFLSEKIARIFTLNRSYVADAALRVLVSLTRHATARLPHHLDRSAEIVERLELEQEYLWRQRQITNARRLIALSAKLGRELISSSDPRLVSQSFLAIGAGLDPVSSYDTEEQAAQKRTLQDQVVALLRLHRLQETGGNLGQISIAKALGWIGTPNAVVELESLANFRNYSAQKSAIQQEYALILHATEALGHIAEPTRNAAGARHAVETLARLLNNKRELQGAPANIDPLRVGTNNMGTNHPRLSVSDLALRQLQQITQTSQKSRSPLFWIESYESLVTQKTPSAP